MQDDQLFTAQHSALRGLPRPQTFDFLGFTHVCATKRANGRFTVRRLTTAKQVRATLKALRQTLNRRKYEPIPVIGKWLRRVVQGSRVRHQATKAHGFYREVLIESTT